MQGKDIEILIGQNKDLVIQIAKRYAAEGIELDDLIQEGNIAVLQAAEKYSPTYNIPFPSYAGKWIQRRIQRAAAKDRSIHVPEHILRAYGKITMTYRILEQQNKCIPTSSDIALKTGMDEKDIKNILDILYNAKDIYSLNTFIDGDESDDEIIDYIPAPLKDTVEIITENSLKADITAILNRLKDRERAIIRMHMGFDSEPKTFEEIGRVLGISRQRVCQLEQKAMRKLGCARNRELLIQYL